MTMQDAVPPRSLTVAEARALVERAGRPAWVIAPATGRILAANAPATALLPMPPDGTACLDAAMPALATLRALLDVPQSGYDTTRTLLLWTPTGALRLTCDIRSVSQRSERGEWLLVVLQSGVAPAKAAAAEQPAEVARIVRDDAETLREIARRIRSGQPRASAGDKDLSADLRQGSARGVMSDTRDDDPAKPPSGTPVAGVADALSPDAMARLAHELKTPLSAIAAAAEIMRDERFGPVGDARYRGYAADIHNSARHALELIARMLAARTSESPAAALEFVEIDPNALIAETLSAIAPLAEQARLILERTLAPRMPHVIADATSIRQILLNLITNALKFTPAGGTIEVATRRQSDGGVAIEVRDTGPGIAAEDLSRALTANAGAPAAPHAKRGLGIGLPLAASLAIANGATLTIDGAPDRGTVAILSFPQTRVVPV